MIDAESIAAQVDRYLADHPDDRRFIDRDQVVQEYLDYRNGGSSIHNARLRDDGQSYLDAMCELDTLAPAEESERTLNALKKVCPS